MIRQAAAWQRFLRLGLLLGLAGLLAMPALGQERPAAPRRPPAVKQAPRPAAKSAPRVPSSPSGVPQARIDTLCVRYRLIYGMDCPGGQGGGSGGMGVRDEVRRLGADAPGKR